MFGKYNDTPAAISLGIYLIGGLFYTVQLLFMTEAWRRLQCLESTTTPLPQSA